MNRLFLEHTGAAIKNCEMVARLAEAQRMSAVRQAVGFVVPDLRGAVGTAQEFVGVVHRRRQWS